MSTDPYVLAAPLRGLLIALLVARGQRSSTGLFLQLSIEDCGNARFRELLKGGGRPRRLPCFLQTHAPYSLGASSRIKSRVTGINSGCLRSWAISANKDSSACCSFTSS